jgi:formamidopyrimidine-DNA glycosylase
MPELPEVDAVVRRLHQAAVNSIIHSVKVERSGTIAPQQVSQFKALHGATILNVRRRAKHIFIDFTKSLHLHIHLRMTGNLYVLPDYNFRPHTTRVWFRLTDNRVVIFEDSRALGKVHLTTPGDIARLEAELGPEPLEPSFTPAVLAHALQNTKSPIKAALLDQRRIAGIGNIYASEALWHARIHPATPANQLPAKKLKPLHAAIQKVLREASASAYTQYAMPGSQIASEDFGVSAYGRAGEPCHRCHQLIVKIVQATRSTFYCPHCQQI